MTLSEFITSVIQQLKLASIDNPQLDARLLVCHALKCARTDLLSQSQRVLNDEEQKTIDTFIARRLKREPVARIIGNREFWGLEFGLNEATLEPRPDSETLIETVLSSLRRRPDSGFKFPPSSSRKSAFNLDSDRHQKNELRILDLGTGTGCLLLALLHELPQAIGTGLDIAPRAVEQASINAIILSLGGRAEFVVSDWFSEIQNKKFDIIVSNPPYIPAADIPTLMPDVRDYDPVLALDGGDDGLTPYRFLIPQLAEYLNPQGLVAFEVGIAQAQRVGDLLQKCGFKDIQTHNDLSGIARCVTAYIS